MSSSSSVCHNTPVRFTLLRLCLPVCLSARLPASACVSVSPARKYYGCRNHYACMLKIPELSKIPCWKPGEVGVIVLRALDTDRFYLSDLCLVPISFSRGEEPRTQKLRSSLQRVKSCQRSPSPSSPPPRPSLLSLEYVRLIVWLASLHLQLRPSLNSGGRWGTTDDFTTSSLYFSLFSTALRDLPNSRPVHSLTLSSHLFLCLPCLLPSLIVPYKMALASLTNRSSALLISSFLAH